MRGTERVHQELPLRFQLLPIVTRMGRDYRPGPRQRIERVTRRVAPFNRLELGASYELKEIFARQVAPQAAQTLPASIFQ